MLKVYESSLVPALTPMFLLSMLMHAWTGARLYSEEQAALGEQPASVAEHLTTSRFWFESLPNWQSEFLAVGVIVVFTIVLRQKGSPESKPVAAPHSMTGSS